MSKTGAEKSYHMASNVILKVLYEIRHTPSCKTTLHCNSQPWKILSGLQANFVGQLKCTKVVNMCHRVVGRDLRGSVGLP